MYNIHIEIRYIYVCKWQFNVPVCVFTDNVISVSQMALVIRGFGLIIHHHMWVFCSYNSQYVCVCMCVCVYPRMTSSACTQIDLIIIVEMMWCIERLISVATCSIGMFWLCYLTGKGKRRRRNEVVMEK